MQDAGRPGHSGRDQGCIAKMRSPELSQEGLANLSNSQAETELRVWAFGFHFEFRMKMGNISAKYISRVEIFPQRDIPNVFYKIIVTQVGNTFSAIRKCETIEIITLKEKVTFRWRDIENEHFEKNQFPQCF